MANHARRGGARRHRSLAYAGVYGGNGLHRTGTRVAVEAEAASEAVAEALTAAASGCTYRCEVCELFECTSPHKIPNTRRRRW